MQTARFLAAALLAGVAAIPGAHGDTAQGGPFYTVNTKSDHDDGVCGNIDCTLREAINAANASPGEIQFASNVRGVITLTGGELLITTGMTIDGPGANLLSIDANSSSRVLHVESGSGQIITISGLTLTHGLVTSTTTVGIVAGGCIFVNGLLGLDSCTISDSSVVGLPPGAGQLGEGRGGGIYFTGSDLQMSNCTIFGNSVAGGDAPERSIGVTGGPAWGGGVFAGTGSQHAFDTCTFSGNTAVGGRGSPVASGGPGGSAQGGAIYFPSTSSLGSNFDWCTISGNSATGGLGGGFMAPDGSGEGGGFYRQLSEPGQNSVFVSNCILAGNLASTDAPDASGFFSSLGYNVIGKTDASSGFTAATDHTGTIATPLDPKLDSAGLQYNGGPTQTIALLQGSVAINNGDPHNAPPRDQRNYLRNHPPDIGAFEFHGTIPSLLYNISTRGFVQTGNNVLIGGVIVTGRGPKKVLLRVLGPTLGQSPFNVPNVLANPSLELFQGSTLIASNDNWGTAANKQAIINTGLAPPNSLESAILISLNPGAYTAIARGVNNTTGNALFEAYDLDNTASSKFGNISTRGFVQTGNNVMIAGVIVHGPDNKDVLVRALGPTLGLPPFNVPNALQDPFLDLRDANGTQIAANDNWKSDQTDIQNTGLAPPHDAESAIAITLAPGNYTAIVTGVNNTTGNALVEIYGLN